MWGIRLVHYCVCNLRTTIYAWQNWCNPQANNHKTWTRTLHAYNWVPNFRLNVNVFIILGVLMNSWLNKSLGPDIHAAICLDSATIIHQINISDLLVRGPPNFCWPRPWHSFWSFYPHFLWRMMDAGLCNRPRLYLHPLNLSVYLLPLYLSVKNWTVCSADCRITTMLMN